MISKREFLKMSGLAVSGAAVDRATLGQAKAAARTNWAGNYTYSTDHVVEASSAAEIRSTIHASSAMRALGSRHAFNAIADSTHEQVTVRALNTMELDAAKRTVTVGAGVRYGELAPWLEERGLALHNLASLPHITVVGACCTATHGSGLRNGNLSTAVTALEFINGRGDLVSLSREQDGDRFQGAVVALGCLGVVTRITLAVQPTFQMRQVVYLDLPFAQLQNHFNEIFGAGYSTSLFTDWQGGKATQVWIKSKVDPAAERATPFHIAPDFFGAHAATRKMHPLLDHPAESTTDQLGIPGPWYERMPHFLMRFTPSSGQELQTEYFVPRARGMAAIRAVEQLRDQITPHLFITELRTIAADDLWMSPCHQQDSLAIHFTWKPEWPAVREILPSIEAALAPFQPRPHWAKLYTMPPAAVQAGYPRLPEFKQLMAAYDPDGKFRNAFINQNLFSA